MKLLSLLALALASANAKEIILDQATDLATTTTTKSTASPSAADHTAGPSAADHKADTNSTVAHPAATNSTAALTPAELKAEDKKCSKEWKLKNGWTFGCMWDHPGM